MVYNAIVTISIHPSANSFQEKRRKSNGCSQAIVWICIVRPTHGATGRMIWGSNFQIPGRNEDRS